MNDFDITLTKKFYDCYSLSLNDMQVIVGRIKDNWRLAHLAGTSNLHVLDKFSITLQCERRIVSSADPGDYFFHRSVLLLSYFSYIQLKRYRCRYEDYLSSFYARNGTVFAIVKL